MIVVIKLGFCEEILVVVVGVLFVSFFFRLSIDRKVEIVVFVGSFEFWGVRGWVRRRESRVFYI